MQPRDPAVAETTIDFLIDTGFTGFLSIPRLWVDRLGLSIVDVQRGITADGQTGYFETVDVTILWHDQPRTIRAQVLEEPLIGSRLLRSHQVHFRWIAGTTFELQHLTE